MSPTATTTTAAPQHKFHNPVLTNSNPNLTQAGITVEVMQLSNPRNPLTGVLTGGSMMNEECGIREVWATNLDEEFRKICQVVQKFHYVAMDTEFPGVVARPIGKAIL